MVLPSMRGTTSSSLLFPLTLSTLILNPLNEVTAKGLHSRTRRPVGLTMRFVILDLGYLVMLRLISSH